MKTIIKLIDKLFNKTSEETLTLYFILIYCLFGIYLTKILMFSNNIVSILILIDYIAILITILYIIHTKYKYLNKEKKYIN